jgi:drug/metabolite transporter superfamily protein YnfA
MTGNVLVFVTAAFLEIAGRFAFWAWLRRGAPPLVALIGIAAPRSSLAVRC